MRGLAVVPLLLLLVLPASAGAATVSLGRGRVHGPDPRTPTFRAAPGERNRVVVTRVRGDQWRFRDPANPVSARGGCEQVDAHAARCPSTDGPPVVRLGDGDDTFADRTDGGGGPSTAHGGPGDDVLRGARGPDVLSGGPGSDRLLGGRGDDVLLDAERDRRSSPDVFDGGPGHGDRVGFEGRRRGLRIDLETGEAGTGDRLTDVEDVSGGSGDDVVTGDGGANGLSGAGGDDRVLGGPGDDSLSGGRGTDRLSGGAGDDELDTHEDERADTSRCGRGTDTVVSEAVDTVAGCEALAADDLHLELAILPVLDADSADFRVPACDAGEAPGCAGILVLSGPDGAAYGAAGYTVAPGARDAAIAVPLTAAAAVLRAGAPLVVELSGYGYRLVLP